MGNNKGIGKCLLLAWIIFTLAGCNEQETAQNEKLTAAATFFPLYELTKMVVGDLGEVFSVIPTNSEPHGFYPSPRDISRLNGADAFITLGIEFEKFEEGLIEPTKKNIIIVKASENIKLIDVLEENQHEDEEEGHDIRGVDPHIWLSPRNMIIMAQNIAEGLKKADPGNAEEYGANANKAELELSKLDAEYGQGLESCKKDAVLVAHNAFSYLGRDYGFKTIEISGLSPEAEPTPRQIARLIDQAKEYGLKHIFYEELADPRISRIIAEQAGAKTLALNPAEGTKEEGATYLSIMRLNLENLKVALECA